MDQTHLEYNALQIKLWEQIGLEEEFIVKITDMVWWSDMWCSHTT